ncbi:MAG TPA: glyoxylate-induced protein, partial [Candidatus Hydrogenedentes bacterium]|nr:glyoxylate-induced protein [Candidatus Hydrogenedentota bacterium]
MPNLSLCVEMVWAEDDIPARIRKAAAIGFKTCEFWGWWNKDLDAVERALKETGIRLGVFCVKTA